jgi:DNA-binding MarR family transcriptional regulator
MEDKELLTYFFCACSNLRGASRVITQSYDKVLEPSGLGITQYGVLVALEKAGPASINALGEFLVMDPTTLNRHLKPLLQKNLVATRPGEDHRVKLVSLTEEGRVTLLAARPLWMQAQSRIIEKMGRERFENFLNDLHFIEDLAL